MNCGDTTWLETGKIVRLVSRSHPIENYIPFLWGYILWKDILHLNETFGRTGGTVISVFECNGAWNVRKRLGGSIREAKRRIKQQKKSATCDVQELYAASHTIFATDDVHKTMGCSLFWPVRYLFCRCARNVLIRKVYSVRIISALVTVTFALIWIVPPY